MTCFMDQFLNIGTQIGGCQQPTKLFEVIEAFNMKKKGWRMVKSETRQDAKTLVRNPSLRLFGKKFRDSKKVKTNHAKTRLRDLSKTLP